MVQTFNNNIPIILMLQTNKSITTIFSVKIILFLFLTTMGFHNQSHQTGLITSPGRALLELSHDLKHKLYLLSTIN